MKVTLIVVGKTSEDYLLDGISVFEKRLVQFCTFQQLIIQPPKASKKLSIEQVKEQESAKIIEKLKPNDYVIVLDEKGKTPDSVAFAGLIEKAALQSSSLVFIVGGAYGVSKALSKKADYVLSLSKMTFTHQLVRLIFMEQLYRAFTILNNHPYHNQ